MNNPSSPKESLPSRAEALLQQGLAASQADDPAQALALFAQAAEAAPGWGAPHFLAGSEHAALREWDRAEAAFAQAVLLAPAWSIARYQLGLLQFSSGRAAVALLTWRPLLELPDSDALPHFVQGFAALAQDDFPLARQHYAVGLERNTENPALSSDIRKILAGIDTVQSPAAAEEGEAQSMEMAQVWLANYQRQSH